MDYSFITLILSLDVIAINQESKSQIVIHLE